MKKNQKQNLPTVEELQSLLSLIESGIQSSKSEVEKLETQLAEAKAYQLDLVSKSDMLFKKINDIDLTRLVPA